MQVRIQNINDSEQEYFARYYSDMNMVYFFNRGKENPSAAKIIAHDKIIKRGLFTRRKFFNKYHSDKFDWLKQDLEEAFANLYPKTGAIKTQLINAGRIALDRVKPKTSKLKNFFNFH